MTIVIVADGSFGEIYANLANFGVLRKLLGGYVALDRVDVSHKTSA